MEETNRYYLGVDIGSTYTKLVVVGGNDEPVFREVMPTLSRRKRRFEETVEQARDLFSIEGVCATGYGRHRFECELRRPELVCASVGVSVTHKTRKCIIDIGGEDLKVIESGADGSVLGFSMNDKCSAGTGTFITEIAEKAELEIAEMSNLARSSITDRTINSFCTVFARTEILEWKFSGVPLEDIARGIYLSLVNRIRRMSVPAGVPVILCGGVIAHHPYLGELMGGAMDAPIEVAHEPQLCVALGAAVIARQIGSRS
ncbi:MAG: acyl-CoA dehydratase activase [Candidatus Eisenbacteria bacterium]